jgi:hypothetical protein
MLASLLLSKASPTGAASQWTFLLWQLGAAIMSNYGRRPHCEGW